MKKAEIEKWEPSGSMGPKTKPSGNGGAVEIAKIAQYQEHENLEIEKRACVRSPFQFEGTSVADSNV